MQKSSAIFVCVYNKRNHQVLFSQIPVHAIKSVCMFFHPFSLLSSISFVKAFNLHTILTGSAKVGVGGGGGDGRGQSKGAWPSGRWMAKAAVVASCQHLVLVCTT